MQADHAFAAFVTAASRSTSLEMSSPSVRMPSISPSPYPPLQTNSTSQRWGSMTRTVQDKSQVMTGPTARTRTAAE
jgi:hypothetical protein